MGWILAAALYAAGCVEVYMRRRSVPAHWGLALFVTIMWPVLVIAALLPSRFSYWQKS